MSYENIVAGGTLETTGTPTATQTKRTASPQSREYTGILVKTAELLDAVTNDVELSNFMNDAGYSPARLAEAAALLQTAHEAYLARQAAMAHQKGTSQAFHAAYGSALLTYRELRGIAANIFDERERIALAVQGLFPPDHDSFAQYARMLYETALADSNLADTFASNGVSPERLQVALAELNAFRTAVMEHDMARAEAHRATANRNTAVTAVRDWRTRFRRRARIATRDRRDLQMKMGL